MLRYVLATAALGAIFTATPTIAQTPDAKHGLAERKRSSKSTDMTPVAAFLSAVALVGLANRRRSLQRVLC